MPTLTKRTTRKADFHPISGSEWVHGYRWQLTSATSIEVTRAEAGRWYAWLRTWSPAKDAFVCAPIEGGQGDAFSPTFAAAGRFGREMGGRTDGELDAIALQTINRHHAQRWVTQ